MNLFYGSPSANRLRKVFYNSPSTNRYRNLFYRTNGERKLLWEQVLSDKQSFHQHVSQYHHVTSAFHVSMSREHVT
eukprot:1337393-Amorphochlora_amoeboformis.AAC.1